MCGHHWHPLLCEISVFIHAGGGPPVPKVFPPRLAMAYTSFCRKAGERRGKEGKMGEPVLVSWSGGKELCSEKRIEAAHLGEDLLA
jgi:hypothetical protein